MRFELDTHKGVILVNPTIELIGTFDDYINETFTPQIVFVSDNIRIGHSLPAQPYINDTWTDEDVQKAIDNYLASIDLDK